MQIKVAGEHSWNIDSELIKVIWGKQDEDECWIWLYQLMNEPNFACKKHNVN